MSSSIDMLLFCCGCSLASTSSSSNSSTSCSSTSAASSPSRSGPSATSLIVLLLGFVSSPMSDSSSLSLSNPLMIFSRISCFFFFLLKEESEVEDWAIFCPFWSADIGGPTLHCTRGLGESPECSRESLLAALGEGIGCYMQWLEILKLPETRVFCTQLGNVVSTVPFFVVYADMAVAVVRGTQRSWWMTLEKL